MDWLAAKATSYFCWTFPILTFGSLLADDVTLARTAQVIERAALGSIETLAPVSRPNTVVVVGANYRDHVVEAGMSMPTSLPFRFRPGSASSPGTARR